MIFRNVVIAAAAALASTVVHAQDTVRTPAARRIVRVSKGEVALPRIDTVYVRLVDTLVINRVDTVRIPPPVSDRIARVETVTVTRAPLVPPRSALYVAAYTGMLMPAGSVDRLYTDGFHAGMAVGWDRDGDLFGFRFNGDVGQLSREQGALASVVGSSQPILVNVGADVKMMPLQFSGWRLYGIGGILASTYRGIATVADNSSGTPVSGRRYRTADDSDWKTRFGWNVGGGADMRLGMQELFVEARAIALRADGANTWFVPLSFGLRFF